MEARFFHRNELLHEIFLRRVEKSFCGSTL